MDAHSIQMQDCSSAAAAWTVLMDAEVNRIIVIIASRSISGCENIVCVELFIVQIIQGVELRARRS